MMIHDIKVGHLPLSSFNLINSTKQNKEMMNTMMKIILLFLFTVSCTSFRPHALNKVFSSRKIMTSVLANNNNNDAFDSSELEYGSSSSGTKSSNKPTVTSTGPKSSPSEDGLWKIDSDSAEIEVGSSSAAQRKVLEPSLTKPVSQVSTPAKPSQVNNNPIALSSSEATGFDFGLLIAFPIMIGTLGLFFVFPFIGESLSQGSN